MNSSNPTGRFPITSKLFQMRSAYNKAFTKKSNKPNPASLLRVFQTLPPVFTELFEIKK